MNKDLTNCITRKMNNNNRIYAPFNINNNISKKKIIFINDFLKSS